MYSDIKETTVWILQSLVLSAGCVGCASSNGDAGGAGGATATKASVSVADTTAASHGASTASTSSTSTSTATSSSGMNLCTRETSYADLLARFMGPSTPPVMDGSRDFAGYCFMDDGNSEPVAGYLHVRPDAADVRALFVYDKKRFLALSVFDSITTRTDRSVDEIVLAAAMGELTSQTFIPDDELNIGPNESTLSRTFDFSFRLSTACNTVLVRVLDPDPGDFHSTPPTVCELDRVLFD